MEPNLIETEQKQRELARYTKLYTRHPNTPYPSPSIGPHSQLHRENLEECRRPQGKTSQPPPPNMVFLRKESLFT